MIVSDKFKDLINKYFYDDLLSVYRLEDQGLDSEGGRRPKVEILKGEIKCNVKPVSSRMIEESTGTRYDALYIITTGRDEDVEEGDILYINDERILVVETLIFDSHMKILGDKDE